MSLAMAGFGLQALSSIASFGQQRAEAKYAKAMQKYNNAMLGISAALATDAITQNEVQTTAAFDRTMVDIKKAALYQEGEARVNAAAAGATGNSVEMAYRDLGGSAARAETAANQELSSSYMAFDAQRRNVVLSRTMQTDHSYIPQPSAASALLGIAKAGVGAYNSAYP